MEVPIRGAMSWAAAWNMAQGQPHLWSGDPQRQPVLLPVWCRHGWPHRFIASILQIAADNGFVGMGLYVAMIASVWADTRFCRRAVKGKDDLESRRIYMVATGVETSMAVFCFGGAFLSLENFELPFLMLLLGSQLAALVKGKLAESKTRLKRAELGQNCRADSGPFRTACHAGNPVGQAF